MTSMQEYKSLCSPVDGVNAKPLEMDRYTRMSRMKGRGMGVKADFGQANLRPEIMFAKFKICGRATISGIKIDQIDAQMTFLNS